MSEYINCLEYTNGDGNPCRYTVGYGDPTCMEINEFSPQGDGDRWCWVIKFSDGTSIREFKADRVHFWPSKATQPNGGTPVAKEQA